MTVSRCGRHGEQRRNQFGVKTPSHAISNRTRQGWARRWDQPWFTTDGAFAAFAMGFACQLDKWLVWLTNTLQSTLIVYFNPKRWVDAGHAAAAAEVKRHAQARVGQLLDQVDAELARHGGPWLLGKKYAALDPYLFTLCRWTRGFSSQPARERLQLGPYLQRMLERPAVQRVLAAEGLQAPFV